MRISNRSGFRHYWRKVDVTTRTAVYGPVRTVVWQGSVGDRRPYADHWVCLGARGTSISPKRGNIRWEADAHEITGKRLRQVFAIWGQQSQVELLRLLLNICQG